jgi:antitoxin component YwqK of YwqJK toxin-antitoxin module
MEEEIDYEKIGFTYMECKISIDDKYELDDISIFVTEAYCAGGTCDFEFEGSYNNIWISFEEETNEVYRVIEIPDNIGSTGDYGNSTYFLADFNSYDEALKYFENLKTISFKKLKKLAGYPDNENLCYFRTKKKEKEILSSDDIKTVTEKSYHENGQIKAEIEFVNDIAHGLYKEYYDNGQLRVTIRFEKGQQVDGVIDSFDENGRLIRTVEIINGNKNGPFKEFYPSGTIKKEGEYKDDEIIGKPIEYYEDGNIKVEGDENEKLNLSSMKLIIKELKIETVLIDFVNSWNKNIDCEDHQLDIETIYDFANERFFYHEIFDIVMDKENNCLFLEIASPFEAFQTISKLYNNDYLMITKSLARIVSKDFDYNLENDDYEELEYTIFSAEDCLGYNNQIGFKSVKYESKVYMTKEDWDLYNNFDEEDFIDFDEGTCWFQPVHFVSKKEFEDGNWFQTIKSFDLYDWDTYPNEF